MISLSFLVMINVQHLLWLVTQITMDTHDTAKMGTVAFWQLYLYLSNLWAIYHRFTHTHATPYLTRIPAMHLSHFKACSLRTVLWLAFLEGHNHSRATFCSIDQCRSQARKPRCLLLCCHVYDCCVLDVDCHFDL